MVLAAAAVERAMKRQEVLMRALSGKLTWLQAADILGMAPRSRIHFLLQEPLVDRADREFRPTEDLRARLLGQSERELGDRPADPPLNPLGAELRPMIILLGGSGFS